MTWGSHWFFLSTLLSSTNKADMTSTKMKYYKEWRKPVITLTLLCVKYIPIMKRNRFIVKLPIQRQCTIQFIIFN